MKLPFLGKKEGEEQVKGRGYVPIDRVKELMGKGFSEIDTIDTLRREGFSPDEIDRALERSIREGIVSGSGPAVPSSGAMQPGGPPSSGFQQLGQAFEQSPAPTFPPRQAQPSPTPAAPSGLPTIEQLGSIGGRSSPSNLAVPETSLPTEYYQGYPTEEYIDYVVQEQMIDVNDRIKEFLILHKDLENRVAEINERLKDVAAGRTGEQEKLIGRMEGFGDTLGDVNMRIASLEKAFKETLPALIESVRALSDLVQRLKREV